MRTIRFITSALVRSIAVLMIALISYILFNSAMDIYNNFAYEKAILKDSPYGVTPLLLDPSDYHSADGFVKCGDFVYVEDWISAANGKTIFAKVRSRTREGYINRDLLVSTNINFKPIISILLLMMLSALGSRKLYNKLSNHNIVFIKN